MRANKILAAVAVCLLLLAAATATGARTGASASGASASGSDGTSRVEAGQRRRAARRAPGKRMSKRKKEREVIEGMWGGAHVRLNVRAGGAELEFDCAHGEIGEPLKTDAEGRFDLPGTFTRQGPGPIRVGLTPAARPARYVGRVEGRTMTFSMKFTDREQETETFTLTRGSEGRLWKCR